MCVISDSFTPVSDNDCNPSEKGVECKHPDKRTNALEAAKIVVANNFLHLISFIVWRIVGDMLHESKEKAFAGVSLGAQIANVLDKCRERISVS